MIGRIQVSVFFSMFDAFISHPHSPTFHSTPQRIHLPISLHSSRAPKWLMLSHLSLHHGATQTLQEEQIVYGNSGTRVRLSTAPLKCNKGSKSSMVDRVPREPGTRVRVSRRCSTLTTPWVVYCNPGTRRTYPRTRLPVSAGTRVPGSGCPQNGAATSNGFTAAHPVGHMVIFSRPGCFSKVTLASLVWFSGRGY